MSENNAKSFIKEFKEKYNSDSWIIGKVTSNLDFEKNKNSAKIILNPNILEV